jgi:isopenicillin N synthase-like dioxygenase
MDRALPIVDLAAADAAAKLRAACENEGFFYVAGHGVAPELTARVRAAAEAFFVLPLEAKLALHFDRASKQRGYIPLEAEATDPTTQAGDLKEALDFTYPIPPDGVSGPVAERMYGENLWPEELPWLRETVESYFGEMIRVGRALFAIAATSLGLPRDFFAGETDRPIAQLRLLHYPPQEAGFGIGIGAHCDYECFTILDPGEVGGLEIQQRGEWVGVDPVPGTFVINLGEMLARWTNDTFRATPHRVLNETGRERFTIPFFFGTNYDTVIECLPPCTGPKRPPRYPPILAGEYLAKRLNEIYGSLPNAGTL